MSAQLLLLLLFQGLVRVDWLIFSECLHMTRELNNKLN